MVKRIAVPAFYTGTPFDYADPDATEGGRRELTPGHQLVLDVIEDWGPIRFPEVVYECRPEVTGTDLDVALYDLTRHGYVGYRASSRTPEPAGYVFLNGRP